MNASHVTIARMKGAWVYILASGRRGYLYVGVTSDLARRMHQHRSGETTGYVAQRRVYRLVYADHVADIEDAIAQEKRMKRWPRQWKFNLIERDNPDWLDLFEILNR